MVGDSIVGAPAVLVVPDHVFHEPAGNHGPDVRATVSVSGSNSPGARGFPPRSRTLLVVVSAVLILAGIVTLTGCSNRDGELFTACEKGDVDRIKDLLDRGAQVNARNRNGETPLLVAAGLLYPDAVRLLIVRGADVNAENSRGETALTVALGARLPEGSPDAEADLDRVVELLVRNGAAR